MARPARVRIRRRKPCFLCRRRLFGWYVRLLTSYLHVLLVGEAVLGRVQDPARTTERRQSRNLLNNWHRPSAREPPEWVTRSWTCGTGRTGLDLPTVRATSTHGQFAENPHGSSRSKRIDRACWARDIHSDTPGNR